MKAGIYDPYLDTLGGGERYCLTVAEILLQNGYEVDLFWSGNQDLISKASSRFSLNLQNLKLVPDIFRLAPQKIELIEEKDSLYHFHRVQPQTGLIGSLKNLYLKYQVTKNYDLFFFLSDGSIPFIFSKKNLLHVQVPFRNPASPKAQVTNFLKQKLIHRVVCNSNFTKRFTDQSYNCQSVVLYPPVDVKKFSPSATKENIILSVGRFDNILNAKKQDILIESFKKLSLQNPGFNWKLVLAGGSLEDPDQNQYLKHLKFLARDANVEFVINASFEDLQNLYSKAKIYWHAAGFEVDENLHPEATEHFGITVVEAMSAGLIPVVIAKGGLPEIVENDKNGYLWNTPDDLVAKTQLMLASPQIITDLARQSQTDSNKYSKENFSQNFLSIIK